MPKSYSSLRLTLFTLSYPPAQSFEQGLKYYKQWYTGVNFIFAAMVLTAHLLIFKNRYFGHFFRAYLVMLIPFMLINGTLTDSWIDESIV